MFSLIILLNRYVHRITFCYAYRILYCLEFRFAIRQSLVRFGISLRSLFRVFGGAFLSQVGIVSNAPQYIAVFPAISKSIWRLNIPHADAGEIQLTLMADPTIAESEHRKFLGGSGEGKPGMEKDTGKMRSRNEMRGYTRITHKYALDSPPPALSARFLPLSARPPFFSPAPHNIRVIDLKLNDPLLKSVSMYFICIFMGPFRRYLLILLLPPALRIFLRIWRALRFHCNIPFFLRCARLPFL